MSANSSLDSGRHMMMRICHLVIGMVVVACGNGPVAFGQDVLRAGDADQDLDFDQSDLVRVLAAAKYNTGHAATWGEGDWGGAPGGRPGAPPSGDGLFDSLDIMAALHQYSYPTTTCTFADCFTVQPGPIETGNPYLQLESHGKFGDGRLSIAYYSETGEVVLDTQSGTELAAISLKSLTGVFSGEPGPDLVCCQSAFDIYADHEVFKVTFGSSFGSISLGNVAARDLPQETVLKDLSVAGVFPFSLSSSSAIRPGERLKEADLIYVPPVPLRAGDANQDFTFDQLDLVQVLQAGKYLSFQHATWQQGDWDGAPGGRLGRPPAGDGIFDQADIMAALRNGYYLQGSYAALNAARLNDEQISIMQDARTSHQATQRLLTANGMASGSLLNVRKPDATALAHVAVPEPGTVTAMWLGLLTLLAVLRQHGPAMPYRGLKCRLFELSPAFSSLEKRP